MLKVSICLLLITAIGSSNGLKCLDEDEREVDWWIFYKTPKLTKGSVSGGETYVYVTSRTISLEQSWIYSPKPITTNGSMIATTLNQIYLNSKMFNYVQYNDELPLSVKSKVTGGNHHFNTLEQ